MVGKLNVTDTVSFLNGLNVSNNTSLVGKLNVTDTVSFFNGLNVSNNTSLVGKLNVTDTVSFLNGLNVSNNTSLVGKLYLTDNARFLNGLNVSNNTYIVGELYVKDNVSFFNGLNVSNNTSLVGKLYLTDNARFLNGLNVSNNTSLIGNLYVSGESNLQSTLFVNDVTTLNNNLNVYGSTNISSITVSAGSTFNSLATFTGGATITNGLSVTNRINSDSIVVSGNLSVNNRLFADTLVYGTLQSVIGYTAYNGPTVNVYDFTGFDTEGIYQNIAGNATFTGTGNTKIENNLKINATSIEMVGSGTTNGIQYTGPLSLTSSGSSINNFNYTGPFNLSTTGITNAMRYGGDVILSGNLRIKSGYNLIIESPTITQVNVSTVVSDDLRIVNQGTGPGLVVNQIDSLDNDIACFQDDTINVFTIGTKGNTTINGGLKIGYAPNLVFNNPLFNMSNNATLDISGDCAVSRNLYLTGNVISYSDRMIKTNIAPIENCLDKIEKIIGYKYERTDLSDNKTHIGLIAQEIEEVFPELVTESNNIKGINYQGFIAILLNCIKELNKKIESKK